MRIPGAKWLRLSAPDPDDAPASSEGGVDGPMYAPGNDGSTVTFSAHGGQVAFRGPGPELADWVRGHLPPGASLDGAATPDARVAVRWLEGCGDGKGCYVLFAGDVPVLKTGDREELLSALESELQFAVATAARDRVFVHAGAVRTPDGSTILLPGRTRTGKSTLVRKLVEAGAVYLSDEYAVLDEAGRVHPFARNLTLRDGDGSRAWHPARHGVEVATGPGPVSMVLATRYQAGARWRPDRITGAEAMLELFSNAVTARTRAELVLSTLRAAVEDARGYRGVRGEADQVVEWLGLGTTQLEMRRSIS